MCRDDPPSGKGSLEREREGEKTKTTKKNPHSTTAAGCYNWLHGDGGGEAERQERKKNKIERGANNKQNKITLKKNGGQQGKRGPEEDRTQRLKRPFVQQFVDAVADLPQRESVLLSVPVQLGQEVAVGEMVEDVVDARVRASR